VGVPTISNDEVFGLNIAMKDALIVTGSNSITHLGEHG
jgi:hypothetical protein